MYPRKSALQFCWVERNRFTQFLLTKTFYFLQFAKSNLQPEHILPFFSGAETPPRRKQGFLSAYFRIDLYFLFCLVGGGVGPDPPGETLRSEQFPFTVLRDFFAVPFSPQFCSPPQTLSIENLSPHRACLRVENESRTAL